MFPSLPKEPFASVRTLLHGFHAPWFLCGGWATDAWLGRQSRDHGDIDIAIFEPDQGVLFAHLPGWFMVGHQGGSATDLWDGRPLTLPAHIHARPPGERNRIMTSEWLRTGAAWAAHDGQDYEFIVNEREPAGWRLSRSPAIALPVSRAFRDSSPGVPTLAPEVVMLFKATAYWGPAPTSGEAINGHPRQRDLDDFIALAPLLTPSEIGWLRGALETIDQAHPWLSHLRC